MKIAAVCCTYKRPVLLGRMIECFLRQDYPADLRELVILDDAGQYGDREGDGWRLVSVAERFATLGEKRNAAAAMVSPDVEVLAVWDDDDIYLPWALSSSAAALREADWSRPGRVLLAHKGGFRQHATGGLFHGGWSYRRDLFHRVGGYPGKNNGEDQALARRMEALAARQIDPLADGRMPFYVYGLDSGSYHLSFMKASAYADLVHRDRGSADLVVGWDRDYTAIPIEPTCRPRYW